jgi:hypothetical protein
VRKSEAAPKPGCLQAVGKLSPAGHNIDSEQPSQAAPVPYHGYTDVPFPLGDRILGRTECFGQACLANPFVEPPPLQALPKGAALEFADARWHIGNAAMPWCCEPAKSKTAHRARAALSVLPAGACSPVDLPLFAAAVHFRDPPPRPLPAHFRPNALVTPTGFEPVSPG